MRFGVFKVRSDTIDIEFFVAQPWSGVLASNLIASVQQFTNVGGYFSYIYSWLKAGLVLTSSMRSSHQKSVLHGKQITYIDIYIYMTECTGPRTVFHLPALSELSQVEMKRWPQSKDMKSWMTPKCKCSREHATVSQSNALATGRVGLGPRKLHHAQSHEVHD